MLDNYKEEQPLFYEQVMHSIMNHKLSHAFLIETNQYEKKDDLILSLLKLYFVQAIILIMIVVMNVIYVI